MTVRNLSCICAHLYIACSITSYLPVKRKMHLVNGILHKYSESPFANILNSEN